jgi:hypothetical protein
MAKELIAPVALVAPIAEVVSVTVPVPMYSLAGVVGAKTAAPLKLLLPIVTVWTKVLRPVVEKPVADKVVPLKVKFAESVWTPLAPLKTTRPEVRLVLVIEELETPVRDVRDVTH